LDFPSSVKPPSEYNPRKYLENPIKTPMKKLAALLGVSLLSLIPAKAVDFQQLRSRIARLRLHHRRIDRTGHTRLERVLLARI
jgi:hypothetical protein